MKLTRREFLKGGTLLAACLVAGLKPKEPEIVNSPWVDLKGFTKAVWIFAGDSHINFVQGPHWPAIYGGAAGGGKTPQLEDILCDSGWRAAMVGGGFVVPPFTAASLAISTDGVDWVEIESWTLAREDTHV